MLLPRPYESKPRGSGGVEVHQSPEAQTHKNLAFFSNGRGPDHHLLVSDGTKHRRQSQSVDPRPFRPPRPAKFGSWFGLVLFRTHATQRTPRRRPAAGTPTSIAGRKHARTGREEIRGSRCSGNVLSF